MLFRNEIQRALEDLKIDGLIDLIFKFFGPLFFCMGQIRVTVLSQSSFMLVKLMRNVGFCFYKDFKILNMLRTL